VALIALAAGFGQFGAVAALGDVAKSFGQTTHGATITDQAGLSGTELGIGLAIIRLASLGALPVSGLADRWGRRGMLLWTAAIGLVLTALAGLSPGYWWFVAIFACGRPLLSGTNAVAQVAVTEQTGAADRAKGVALVAAGYGVGAGLIAVIHSLGLSGSGFRILFALSLLPLVMLLGVRGWITESDRFAIEAARSEHPLPVLGVVGSSMRGRLAIVASLAFALSVITGPATSFAFLYAQNILHQPSGVTAAMVVVAGVGGLGGLVLGRWMADHLGRRPAAALGMVGLALFGVLAYSGSSAALVIGYVFGVAAGSVLAPGVGSIINEVFPTAVRASVLGWWVAAGVVGAAVGLVVFGAVIDAGNRFVLGALITFLPAAAATGLFWLLPETRGREPEEISTICVQNDTV
jgi:MFS family permease